MRSESVNSVHSVYTHHVNTVEICSTDDVLLESGAQIYWLPDEGGNPRQFPKDMPAQARRGEMTQTVQQVWRQKARAAEPMSQRVGLTLHGPKR